MQTKDSPEVQVPLINDIPGLAEQPARRNILPIIVTLIASSVVFGLLGYALGKNSAPAGPIENQTLDNQSEEVVSKINESQNGERADSGVPPYQNLALGLRLKPSENWEYQEECDKLGYSTSSPCFFSSDFQEIRESVEPGDGGVDEQTVETIGNLLLIEPEVHPFSFEAFCSPGGPSFVENCIESEIGEFEVAQRDLGSSKDTVGVRDVWFIEDTEVIAKFTYFFSTENKQADLEQLNQVLSTVELFESQ